MTRGASAIDAIIAPRARDIDERQRLVARELANARPNHAAAEKVAVVHRLAKAMGVRADSVDIAIGVDTVLALTRCRIDRIAAILDGRQPLGLSAERMSVAADLAKEWSEQRRDLGFG